MPGSGPWDRPAGSRLPGAPAHGHLIPKHIGFGLFFAAPIAGLGLSRLLGDHFRRPHIAVGIWSLALVLGLVQSGHLYQVWPNSKQFVRAFSNYLKPHARYLVEVPEVPIYYLLGHADARPRQFTSTFYINYRNSKRVLLSGTVGFIAAVDAGYFDVVAYNNEVTGATDAVLAQALSASKDYYLAAEIHITDVFRTGRLLHLGQGAAAEAQGRVRPRQLEVPGSRHQDQRTRPLTRQAQFVETLHVTHHHGPLRRGLAGGGGAPALSVGERPAHRQGEQDGVTMIDGRRSRRPSPTRLSLTL